MKARHRADLVWRFQHAEEEIATVSGAESAMEARLFANERAGRVDAALGCLPTEPVSLARVLFLRYGIANVRPEIRAVLGEHAGVASVTPEAAGPLGALCARIRSREATGDDTVAIDEVRRRAEALLVEAERAYEAACAGRTRSSSDGPRATKKLKPFYTVRDLARALGVSRWTVRRWLDANRIPYELCRSPRATRGGRLIVLLSELRTYAPGYFSSMRGDLEVDAE